jgi:hypothetical protein
MNVIHKKLSIVLILVTVIVSVITVNAGAVTYPCDTGSSISTNTTWALSNSPYVVKCSITVNSGVTLTIEPGTVVKFSSSSYSLNINGTLEQNGWVSERMGVRTDGCPERMGVRSPFFSCIMLFLTPVS